MKEPNHSDNNDQLPGNIESVDSDFDTTVGSYIVRTEYENGTENSQRNITINESMPVSEKEDVESLDKAQIADSGLLPIDQNKSNIEQIAVSSNENINTSLDSIVKNEPNTIDSASVVQSVGHILRRARVAKGMSIDDVSRQLRLSVQQIGAIEKEDFEKLPGRTFLRGFIRNYANLVQLDPVPLLQLIPESAPVISTYERTPFKNKQISFASNRESSGNNRLITVIVLFVMILGGYFIFEDNNKSDNNSVNNEVKTDAEKTSVEIQLPLPAAVKNVTNGQTNKIPETNDSINREENSATESGIKIEPIVIPIESKPLVQETRKPVVAPSDLGNLYFKFTADSWVKVVDGKGVSLFEQLKKGGSEQIITGKKPLSIVVGNASGVNLTYNDTEIDISSYKKQDGTARFTLK